METKRVYTPRQILIGKALQLIAMDFDDMVVNDDVIVALGSLAKREPKAAQQLRNAFLTVETQSAGRLILGVN